MHLFWPHQLCLAPGDTVAGIYAEVAFSRDFDFGLFLALLFVLRCQHPQETFGEILL